MLTQEHVTRGKIMFSAFVTSRYDYCDSLYYSISQSFISHLYLVQNAATKQLEGNQKYDHITPILMSLHWLPVNNIAPQYLTDLLLSYTSSRNMRSCALVYS